MVRVGSSSSAPGVNPTEQNENAFEQLISKIEPADFDLRPFLKQLKVLGRYELIKRNVYCTKRRVEDHGISCCCKPSPGSSVVCGRDCHCGMLFSCCSSQCECDNACTNKSFQHRPRKKTKLIKTEKCGHGLVAEDAIKKGEFVIEYVGEVIDDRTCEERLWTMKWLNDTDFYLCEVSSNMVIDATYKGNLSRFINHSCEPNTMMQKWTVDGETRVGIFALSDIKIGEELTYDYKFVRVAAAQVCHCGSSNCRKMLGTTKYSGSSQNHQAKKKKRETSFENSTQQFLRLWHPQQKMYVGCWIVDFNQETKMHTLQFIDLHTKKFDLKEEWHFLEAQDTPTSSPLDLGLEDYLGEGEVSSSAKKTEKILSKDVKNRLLEMLSYLKKDTAELIQDAEPICTIFKAVKDQLSSELISVISPAAYIGSHEIKVKKAKQNLADRLAQANLTEQKALVNQEVINLKEKHEDLNKTHAQLDETISQLKTQEAHLISQLEQIQAAIQANEQKKIQVVEDVDRFTEEIKVKAYQFKALHNDIKLIPGSADEDNKAIREVDEIRLCAMKAIQNALGL